MEEDTPFERTAFVVDRASNKEVVGRGGGLDEGESSALLIVVCDGVGA